MKGLQFSVWAASCISLGLFMAYVDGVGMRGIIGGAMVWSIVIAGATASVYIFHVLKRKRLLQRRTPHQPPRQQDVKEEGINAAEFKAAAMMIGGAAMGFLIGSMLFTELYAIVASSIIGCATIPVTAMWWKRRARRKE